MTDIKAQKAKAFKRLDTLTLAIEGLTTPLQDLRNDMDLLTEESIELRILMIDIRDATTNRNPKLSERGWAESVAYCMDVQNAMGDYNLALRKLIDSISELTQSKPIIYVDTNQRK